MCVLRLLMEFNHLYLFLSNCLQICILTPWSFLYNYVLFFRTNKNNYCFYQAVREQLVQMMFETFNVSGFYASEQAVLSLYAVGRISGCTVDIGHGKIGMSTWQMELILMAWLSILIWQRVWNWYSRVSLRGVWFTTYQSLFNLFRLVNDIK